MRPPLVRMLWLERIDETVGFSPLAVRNSSVARTRRSATFARMSRLPEAFSWTLWSARIRLRRAAVISSICPAVGS